MATVAARLKERYQTAIVPELMAEFKYENIMQVPRLEKVVLNVGVGDAPREPRMMESALQELGLITGRRGSIRKARRSIAGFKVREGTPVGCMVTLRGAEMYEFLDRLFNVAIPRIRDFRGVPNKSFDKAGNYTLGLREQTIFPEVDIDSVARVRGMNLTFVVKNARTVSESIALLRKLGMPFRN